MGQKPNAKRLDKAGIEMRRFAIGPVFVDLKVEPGESYLQHFICMHGPAARAKFKAALR